MEKNKSPVTCVYFCAVKFLFSMEHNCTVSDVMHVSNTRWESLPDEY